MVRFISQKTKILSSIVGLILGLGLIPAQVFADTVKTECATGPSCDADTTFQVNVHEFLLVTLSLPDNWASGNINTLLRNPVSLSVSSNNGVGFIAYMTTKTTDTNLNNISTGSSDYIETLPAPTTASAFTTNRWGYSLNDITGENPTGSDSANYSALVGSNQTPDMILSRGYNDFTTKTANITFGAKADDTIDAGTYSNTVVFSVVSGVNTEPTDPTTPVNPANPSDPGSAGANPTYNQSQDRTVATTTNNSGTTTTTTITSGDTRTTYSSPAGVTTSNIGGGSPLATGLAVTAAVAATTGLFFFIVAKRRKEDEDEEDEDY